MTEIVVISGKGGTGKTSVTASLAFLSEIPLVIADCDVDAANMHLLLEPDFMSTEDFLSGSFARIDNDKCSVCNECAMVCRFDAININNGGYSVSKIDCEGCGYCQQVCTSNAIEMIVNNTGEVYCSNTRIEKLLVHAKLSIGAENSGKLVTQVRLKAKAMAEKSEISTILIDGTPGIGCPVIASITGSNYVVIVTEPTVSGLHDLERVFQLTKNMGIETGCVINKWDLNSEKCIDIENYLLENSICLLGKLPYHNSFNDAVTKGLTVTEVPEGKFLKQLFMDVWIKINQKIEKS